MEWFWEGKHWISWRNTVPTSLCPPQMTQALNWDRTLVTTVWDWRLTAWSMARPLIECNSPKRNRIQNAFNTEQHTCVYLTIWRLTATIWVLPHSWPPDAAFYIFIQQIHILNILNMLHNLRFFLFKMPFIS